MFIFLIMCTSNICSYWLLLALAYTFLYEPNMPAWAAWMLIYNALCVLIVCVLSALVTHSQSYICVRTSTLRSHCTRLYASNKLSLSEHVCYCALVCYVVALVYALFVNTPVRSTRVYSERACFPVTKPSSSSELKQMNHSSTVQ